MESAEETMELGKKNQKRQKKWHQMKKDHVWKLMDEFYNNP